MSKSRIRLAVITCSERVTSQLLGCSLVEILQKERRGQLRHSQFWKAHGLANARSLFRQYWESYDVRHYLIEDVISLLPDKAPAAADLTQLKRQYRHLMAGQVELTSWRMPYIGIAIAASGLTITSQAIIRVPKRPQTLPGTAGTHLL